MQLVEQYKPELAETLPQEEYFRMNRKKDGSEMVKDNSTLIRPSNDGHLLPGEKGNAVNPVKI